MREKLKKFIDYAEGKRIRKILHEKSKKEYIPKYSEQYLNFMNDNECSFSINGFQEVNFPYYFTLFTEKSQYVQGDCIEECLDKAISIGVKPIGDNLSKGIKKFYCNKMNQYKPKSRFDYDEIKEVLEHEKILFTYPSPGCFKIDAPNLITLMFYPKSDKLVWLRDKLDYQHKYINEDLSNILDKIKSLL